MKVVILCGGLGTRLREETEFRPKPMVNIGQRPILWHIMKYYACHGFKEFVLPLGYKGDMIKDYFYNYEARNNDITIELGKPEYSCLHCGHEEQGWQITLAETGLNTLKGGRLKRVQQYIDGDYFMLTYGDGLSDVDLNALLAFHKSHKKMVTVTGVNPASRFGVLDTDGDCVLSFHEKPQAANKDIISGGFFVINREIFDYLTSDEGCDLEYGVLERIAGMGELMVFRHDGFWACMDTIRDTDYLNSVWNSDSAPWKKW